MHFSVVIKNPFFTLEFDRFRVLLELVEVGLVPLISSWMLSVEKDVEGRELTH
jgi:hypothetical protein